MRVNWDNVKEHRGKILDSVIEDLRNVNETAFAGFRKNVDVAARAQPESNRGALEGIIAMQFTVMMLRHIALFLETSTHKYLHENHQDNEQDKNN